MTPNLTQSPEIKPSLDPHIEKDLHSSHVIESAPGQRETTPSPVTRPNEAALAADQAEHIRTSLQSEEVAATTPEGVDKERTEGFVQLIREKGVKAGLAELINASKLELHPNEVVNGLMQTKLKPDIDLTKPEDLEM